MADNIRYCPIYKHSGGNVIWAVCPSYEIVDSRGDASSMGCGSAECVEIKRGKTVEKKGREPCPKWLKDLIEAEIGEEYTKLDDRARCPIELRGEIDECHSNQVYFETKKRGTVKLRAFLLQIKLNTHDRCFLPIALETARRHPKGQRARVIESHHPCYTIACNGLRYFALIENEMAKR